MKTKSIVLILFGFLLVQFNQAQIPSKTSADTEWFIYLKKCMIRVKEIIFIRLKEVRLIRLERDYSLQKNKSN